MRLLALDTATELCSAALWLDGPAPMREAKRERGHAELILPMIDELLVETGVTLRQLDAIAFGCGPGAFTGVRLAVSLAQGLAWSSQLPLIPVSDLRAVAAQSLRAVDAARALVCMDARMHEIYWGCFERERDCIRPVGGESVGPPSAVTLPHGWAPAAVQAAGTGFGAYGPELSNRLPGMQSVDAGALPHARDIAWLAATDGLAASLRPEEAQPVYLRDDVARVPASVVGASSPN